MSSDLENAVDSFRDALLRRERLAAADLAMRYGAAYGRIAEVLDALLDRIAAAQAAGEEVGTAWLLRQQRYQALLRQIEVELAAFGVAATELITEEQRAAVVRALGHAEQLTLAGLGAPPAGVIVAWNRVPAETLQALAGALQDGSPLRTLFDAFGPEASAAVQQTLFTGVLMGQNPKVIAQQVRRALGVQLTRALTISRTEVLRAYRTATLEGYRANPQYVKAWRWNAARQVRTCPVCWAMHGRVFPLSEPFASHPNCRCSPTPVTVSWSELGFSAISDRPALPTGPDLFRALPEESQRAILGPAKLELYQAGRLRLPDLVGERYSPQWGLTRYEKSLKELGL